MTPMEVIKIRLQAQHHSMADPLDIPKYRNAAHALYTVVKEEGIGALYRGVSLTALRQGTNQAGKSQRSRDQVLQVLHKCKARPHITKTNSISSQFYRLFLSSHKTPGLPWISRSPRLANIPHWSRLRCHGPFFQRANRHHQNPSPENSRKTRRDGRLAHCEHCG